MLSIGSQLLKLYITLGSGVLVGWFLGRRLPKVVPEYLGKFLFWVGVPISIFGFLRQADLSGQIWIAPIVAWVAILLGIGLAWIWIYIQTYWQPVDIEPRSKLWLKATQGSFLLSAMVGNTGYLGFPITLALVGQEYFGWALFYDLLGSTLGSYGLGVLLAARFGMGKQSYSYLAQALVNNPALWSFGLGLTIHQVQLPKLAEQSLQFSAWGSVALALVLIGMRLGQLSSWGSWRRASISLGIKMLIVPLTLGMGLSILGLKGAPIVAIVLQMAMPPAFATLVLAETYNLDRELAVTAIALGSIALIFTLPIWLLLFRT
jgi:predicted permease